ncbi:MAG TPA: hypothetical protein VNU94_04605 [Acidobacteriaceae bacterium]|jgi:hypothetical protein|nr:hypothetical protein [Acidobacteriaceae bacterium]
MIKHQRKTYLIGAASALIYAAFIFSFYYLGKIFPNLDLTINDSLVGGSLSVMSIGFLVCVPFALGWISIRPLAESRSNNWVTWIFFPWLPVIVSDLVLLLLCWEGAICILYALPITFFFASVGGISAGLYSRRLRNKRATTICLVMLPLIVTLTESRLSAPQDIRSVETSIVIHAPVSTIWQNIKSVRAISPAELRPTWTHRIGFPRPIEATLDRDGIGGVRKASFEGGVLFTETITDWQPDKTIAFSIKADTNEIPPSTLDEHVTVGGKYFDVLNGRYTIEPRTDSSVVLHLVSNERISTDFNWYAGLWTDASMRSLQQSILEVIQHRCESGHPTIPPD